jgi:hypothetical protein
VHGVDWSFLLDPKSINNWYISQKSDSARLLVEVNITSHDLSIHDQDDMKINL